MCLKVNKITANENWSFIRKTLYPKEDQKYDKINEKEIDLILLIEIKRYFWKELLNCDKRENNYSFRFLMLYNRDFKNNDRSFNHNGTFYKLFKFYVSNYLDNNTIISFCYVFFLILFFVFSGVGLPIRSWRGSIPLLILALKVIKKWKLTSL